MRLILTKYNTQNSNNRIEYLIKNPVEVESLIINHMSIWNTFENINYNYKYI